LCDVNIEYTKTLKMMKMDRGKVCIVAEGAYSVANILIIFIAFAAIGD
jgi:hypothetical protein